MIISIIVAMDDKGGIGKDGKLPWHIPEDLKRFKELTMGHPIIMGRKTHESIGRVLPGRSNIIITRDPDYRVEGATVCHSPEAALQLCDENDEVFIIGGAEVYEQFLHITDKIYVTQIHKRYPADTYFPWTTFRNCKSLERTTVEGDPSYSNVVFQTPKSTQEVENSTGSRTDLSEEEISLIKKIRSAFSGKSFPGNGSITRCSYDHRNGGNDGGPCDECVEIAEYFKNKRQWQACSAEFLRGQDAALSLMTIEAVRFFLPAYLIQSILNPNELDVLCDYIIWSFSPYDKKDNFSEKRCVDLYRSMDSSQRAVYIEYMNYRKQDGDDFNEPYIDALLRLIQVNFPGE